MSSAWECPCGVSNPAGREKCRGCGVSAERATMVAAQEGDRLEKELTRYDHIRVSTTPEIPGARSKESLGIVTAEVILGMHVFKDVTAAFRDVVGGRVTAYEKELQYGKQVVIRELRAECQKMGGAALVGVRLDYEAISPSMLMITAHGTVVVLE